MLTSCRLRTHVRVYLLRALRKIWKSQGKQPPLMQMTHWLKSHSRTHSHCKTMIDDRRCGERAANINPFPGQAEVLSLTDNLIPASLREPPFEPVYFDTGLAVGTLLWEQKNQSLPLPWPHWLDCWCTPVNQEETIWIGKSPDHTYLKKQPTVTWEICLSLD